MTMSFCELKNIRKSFGSGDNRVEVLKGIDLNIEKGEICVLLGPSGSGKSTLLNIIGGIETADEGSISVNGERIADMGEKALTEYRRHHLGYVFQTYNLIPNLTVRENIEVGAYLSKNPLEIDSLMETLGISEKKETSCRISFREVSSKGLQSAGQLSKTPIFFCVTSLRELLITQPQKKS